MNRKGFSLIEVLVATALLVMVVGMIGFVFRQSSMSWDSGIKRADGISQMRAVMGAIERDLHFAVDAREFGLNNNFENMEFVALLDPDPKNSSTLNERVPAKIKYTISGGKVERTATRLKRSGNSWSASGTKTGPSTLLDDNAVKSFSVDAYYADDDDDEGLPRFVTAKSDITVSTEFSGLEVRSYGPNGKKSTDEVKIGDDIVVK